MKKFKHVDVNGMRTSHQARSLSPGQLYLEQSGLHDRLVNGPTLSPQGQVDIISGQLSNGVPITSPPPGLRSPPGPPTYSNGYTHHVNPQNGYSPGAYTQPSTTFSNNDNSRNPASSGTYQYRQNINTPQQAQPVPPSANPFHNSFDRQRANRPLSPLANNPALSPLQQTYSPGSASYSYMPATNGLPSHTYSLPPPLPPPVKHQSPPAAPAANHVPSSSPTMGPSLPPQAPPSPGFSPTKHTSPRPAPLSNPRADSVVSPTLQKAPQSPGLSPIKQRSPRPAPLSNGQGDPSTSPIAGPALLSKSAPSPGFSPTKQSPPRPPPSLSNGVVPPVETLNPSPPRGQKDNGN